MAERKRKRERERERADGEGGERRGGGHGGVAVRDVVRFTPGQMFSPQRLSVLFGVCVCVCVCIKTLSMEL